MIEVIITNVDQLTVMTQFDSDPLVKHVTATCHYEILVNNSSDVIKGSVRKLWDSEYSAESEDINDMIAICRSSAEEFLQDKFGDL